MNMGYPFDGKRYEKASQCQGTELIEELHLNEHSNAALHWLRDHEQVLTKIYHALKPGALCASNLEVMALHLY